MVSMPLALLIGAGVILMVRKGGWAAFPVVAATVFGLVLASTDLGGALTDQINAISKALFAQLAQVGQ
jgi:hypothetical protein